MKLSLAAIFLVAALSAIPAPAQTAMLAPTPPMGWSTWNRYQHDISDTLVRAQADAMVASGMRDAGYVYINIDGGWIDGGWQGWRDAAGVLHPNSAFPDMKALADYIHAKGLKFGLYSGPGPVSCGGAVTSYGFEEQDAKLFASWGVDFLKYDLCSFRTIMRQQSGGDVEKSNALMKAAYEKMGRALAASGRPILYSLCQYGWGEVWQWGADAGGQMWRTSGDIADSYASMSLNGFGEAGLSSFAGPGRWNDPDILEVGNGGLSPVEERTHFSLWAMLAAPLIAGNDLTHMSEGTKEILLNKEIIGVDQDALGKEGDRAYAIGPLEVWTKPLAGGAMAVALFNRTTTGTLMTLRLKEIAWQGPATARDLWAHEDIGTISGEKTFTVSGHGVVMLRLSHSAR
jgi:alpha-galactosidase